MAENDCAEMLEKYALPKLDEYSKIVKDLLFRCGVYAQVGSPDEEECQRQRHINKEVYSKLIAYSLEALVILGGDKEKLRACLNLALARNSTERRQGPYAVLTSINTDSFCGELRSLAYLLEEKEVDDYLKSGIEACDKTLKGVAEKAGFEYDGIKGDKLPEKRKK